LLKNVRSCQENLSTICFNFSYKQPFSGILEDIKKSPASSKKLSRIKLALVAIIKALPV
jgi:hypothetical protein